MRSQRRNPAAWRAVSNDPLSESDVFNETLPQQSSRLATPERRASRLPLPSVRPLNPGPRIDSGQSQQAHRLDPWQAEEFYNSRVSPSRRRTASVASSHQSNGSLAPSSLRYLGRTPNVKLSPDDFLGSRERVESTRHSPAPQAPPQSPAHFHVRSTTPSVIASETRAPLLHPLLKQALLLTAAAEVEDRLAVQQENTDAFGDILALFSVAKEVEAIRVAAFDMFDLEASARRALCAQQKRERHVVWCWYLESLTNAVLFREVRALQLEKGRVPSRQSESLLRSRGASLQPSAYDLFHPALQPSGPLPERRSFQSTKVESTARSIAPGSPKRQLIYPSTDTRREVFTPRRRQIELRDSPSSSSSYSYSASSASSPARKERSPSQSLGSVNVADELKSPSRAGYAATSERALDDRIARQQLLLASAETRRSNQAPLLFPKRAPPLMPGR